MEDDQYLAEDEEENEEEKDEEKEGEENMKIKIGRCEKT